jgi:two-component system response regulator RegX3
VPERILLADDEPALLRSVTYALSREGFTVDTVVDGRAALDAAHAEPYDLAILDIQMPELNGLEVCRQIRAVSTLPIILLTARDSEMDTVIGLEAGADDYVSKPFSVAELVGRVRAHLRRRRLDASETPSPRLTQSGVRIDLVSRSVDVDDVAVHLTAAEFDLLHLLVSSPGRVFTRRSIMEHLWRTPFFGDERAADAHISNLRRKIERDTSRPERILTVRSVGYKFAADGA